MTRAGTADGGAGDAVGTRCGLEREATPRTHFRRREIAELTVHACRGSVESEEMRETLYRYRYLLLGIILAAIVGQITFEYSSAKSHIDLSSGGIADWPQYGRDQEGTRYTPLDQINRDNVGVSGEGVGISHR